jgi:biopolymer transport protein ExbD
MQLPLATARRHNNPDDRLIPLINIVFLMLIFFMVAGHITRQRTPGDVTLPASTQINPAEQYQRVLAVNAKGELTLDAQSVSAEELATALQPQLAADPELVVQLALDRDLQAQTLTPLLKQLRELGLQKVTLISVRTTTP